MGFKVSRWSCLSSVHLPYVRTSVRPFLFLFPYDNLSKYKLGMCIDIVESCTRANSSLKQSEIEMPFEIRLLPLLKVQRMV